METFTDGRVEGIELDDELYTSASMDVFDPSNNPVVAMPHHPKDTDTHQPSQSPMSLSPLSDHTTHPPADSPSCSSSFSSSLSSPSSSPSPSSSAQLSSSHHTPAPSKASSFNSFSTTYFDSSLITSSDVPAANTSPLILSSPSPSLTPCLDEIEVCGETDHSQNLVICFYSVLRELNLASDIWNFERAEEKRKELEGIAAELEVLKMRMSDERDRSEHSGDDVSAQDEERISELFSNLERTLAVFEKVRPKHL